MGYRSMNKPGRVGSQAGRPIGRARAVRGRPVQRDSRLVGSVAVKRDALAVAAPGALPQEEQGARLRSKVRAMRERPRVCVIGAGVSGLTAVKALGDWDVPHSCFEASDDVGGNWYFLTQTAAHRRIARCTSTRPRPRSVSATFRWTSAIQTSRITPRSTAFCATTPTGSGCGIGSDSALRWRTPRGWTAAVGTSTANGSTRCWSATATTGTRPTQASRAALTDRRSIRTTTSTPPSRSRYRASACSSSGSATAPSTSSPSSHARGSPSAC